jgi:streptogramin lyase
MTGVRRYWTSVLMGLGTMLLSVVCDAQVATEYPLPYGLSPKGIAAGSDGALWFTIFFSQDNMGIGRITTSGVITYPGMISHTGEKIVDGPDGALWFTDITSNAIGRVDISGHFTDYSIPTANSYVNGIVAGPDGALWFTESYGNKVGRITTGGQITEFSTNPQGLTPLYIAAGSDGALWFTNSTTSGSGQIGRITTAGAITEFPLPVLPYDLTAGPDGALWFGALGSDQPGSSLIGRVTTAGNVSTFPIGTSASADVEGIVAGPDRALWFVETSGNKIGRITTSGVVTEYSIPTTGSTPIGITAGPDGALWFTESEGYNIGRITTGNATGLVSAVLPSSRSVQVGNTATAFATMINSGSSAANGCQIVPVTSVPASFLYQTTNPTTNALTGSPNTPITIAGNNGTQTFVVALTPNAAVVPTTVELGFDCAGVNAAPSNNGLNTLFFSASTTPVPDVVALAASGDPGYVDIPGTTGTGVFAVATVNLGSDATITATANTGSANLPVTLTVCQTNPTSGACLAPPAPSATTDIQPKATPTFGIFVTGSAAVANSPGVNRVFVAFTDSGGVLRGETSVAVRTQ